MFTYKVYEDFIPEEYQDEIENYLLNDMLWKYNNNISGMALSLPNTPVPLASDQAGFTGRIYGPSVGWETDMRMSSILHPMIQSVRNIFPFDIQLTRVRGGLFTKGIGDGIHFPHVDFYYPHYTFLYYANESDGDTIIWNETAPLFDPSPEYPSSFSELARVSPKRGTAVLFNGLFYHSSTPPQNHNVRLAINLNFVPFGAGGQE